jgi:tRNA threonylcarbamoyladenosine biosynthesis protein TsaE
MAVTNKSTDTYQVSDEAAMRSLGKMLAALLPTPAIVTLSGELGAGKSVLARAIIHSLGYSGAVKSPTYTLVETYSTATHSIAHMDLYRLADPDELNYIGFDDVLSQHDLILIEWPEQAGDLLPAADLAVTIDYEGDLTRQVSVLRKS